jgi:hypothetical protein
MLFFRPCWFFIAEKTIKNYPQLLGEAKVREFDIWKNLWTDFLS